MAKRAARRAKLHAIDSARIHNLVFDHTPANDRDQSYIRKIRPRSDNQRILMEAIDSQAADRGPRARPAPARPTWPFPPPSRPWRPARVSRIVLSRPAVEAGENLGFLPGDMREKLDPYLRPLWDALNDRLGAKRLRQHLDDGTIEIAPGRLHARPHAQQQLRADRRGAELHLRPAQDAADPAGLALDHGDDRRSRPDRPAARAVGPGHRSPRSWKGSRTSPSCA